MKKRLYLMGLSLIILALVFSAIGCAEGPVGPQGIQGIQGAAGATGSQGPQGVRGDTGEPGTGTSIVWMGTATSAPKSWRVLNYAYYNSAKGASYIWDGNSWEIWAKDGYDGAIGATGPRGYTGATGADGAKGAPGEPGIQGVSGEQGLVGEIVAVSAPTPQLASTFYQGAFIVDSIVLGEGDWMIVASGAMDVSDDGFALNVGLRIWIDGTAWMIAKSNILSEAGCATISRIGFALVGTVSVPAGQTLAVELVHRGGGDLTPFEYNIVAIGGIAP